MGLAGLAFEGFAALAEGAFGLAGGRECGLGGCQFTRQPVALGFELFPALAFR